ncbi:AAA family ATPase [Candidatus Roizmanbacteria bacterium]|nr:AAA family ATPase [Candidatus Roizmanbacteria bacterium]
MTGTKKIIVAIVGLPGAGKTTAAEYLSKQKKIPVVTFGDVVNKYIDQHKLPHTREIHTKTWKKLRKDYGMEAFARLNVENIKKGLSKNAMVIIDGMRSWEEYLYLKRKFSKESLYIIAIFTDKRKRYKRSAKRTYRAKLYGPERDIDELFGTNMGPTITMADYAIENNGAKEEFYRKLDTIFAKLNNNS